MLGDILKEARRKQGMTQSTLSEQVGVTAGYISNIEHNRLEPSLPVLCDLVDKLGIPPLALFAEQEAEQAVVCRKNARPAVPFSNLPELCEVLTPFSWRSKDEAEISAIHLSIPLGSNLRTDEPALGSDEFIYVMSGELEYNCGGESLNISAGHGVFVPYMTGRSLSNASGKPAEILWIAKSKIEETGQASGSVKNESEVKPKPEPPSEPEDIYSEPAMSFAGGNIRKLRMERGMTAASLAEEIDMTSAYVSRVERGLVEPSLPVLRSITDALDVEMIYLFSVPFTGDIKISNIFDRTDEIVIPGDKAIIQLLTPSKLANGDKPHIFVIGIRLEGGQVDCEEFVVHNFVEFTYVVEGEVEYVTDSGSYLCKAGDAIYIKRNVPHQLHNPGKKDCKLITALGNIAHNYVQETSKGINA